MLAIKIIPFCKYNKNWYRAWGKWHKIIFNTGKILIFFFFFVLNSWNASHENNFSIYENIMIKSMGKIIQNYSLYSLHKVWSAKCPLLVHCRPVHGPLVCMVWSADYTQPINNLNYHKGLKTNYNWPEISHLINRLPNIKTNITINQSSRKHC